MVVVFTIIITHNNCYVGKSASEEICFFVVMHTVQQPTSCKKLTNAFAVLCLEEFVSVR